MNILNNLTDKLLSIQFSSRLDRIEDWIVDTLPRLIENLALVYLTTDDNATRLHWKSELVGNISRYNGQKYKRNVGKDKFPKEETYFDFLWKNSKYCDSPESFNYLLKEKFKKEKLELTDEMIEQTRLWVENFMKKLAKRLSKGYLPNIELYQLLEEK